MKIKYTGLYIVAILGSGVMMMGHLALGNIKMALLWFAVAAINILLSL